jgi:transcriptional regulator with XRE-family HTH domain
VQEEEDRRGARGSGAEPGGAGMEPPLGGGGLRLPGLRRSRLRRGLTQQRLAERAGLDQRQLSKIETGSRGCNPAAARRLAGELGVDVAELRVRPREQETHPAKPRAPRRNLHRAYLGVLLGREVGSAYTVMGEEALERHCKGLSWEGVLEVTRQKARGAGPEGAARRHGPPRGGAPVSGGGPRHLPRPGHTPPGGGPRPGGFRGRPRGTHPGHARGPVTLRA